MSSPEWLTIYRSYSDGDLAAEVTSLKRQATNLSSQTVGSQSYAQDLREVRDRLHAAITVQNERRTAGVNPSVGVADFSGVRV
jgi:ribosomal protein L29